MKNLSIFALCFGIFLLGMVVGLTLSFSNDFKYKDASVMTCNYANNLTNIINIQSDQLTLCSGFNYTRLDKLNCNLLGGK